MFELTREFLLTVWKSDGRREHKLDSKSGRDYDLSGLTQNQCLSVNNQTTYRHLAGTKISLYEICVTLYPSLFSFNFKQILCPIYFFVQNTISLSEQNLNRTFFPNPISRQSVEIKFVILSSVENVGEIELF